MNHLRCLLPSPRLLEHSPELAPLAILDAALTACEIAILAAYPEVYNGANQDAPRGSSSVRASAIIIQSRRLSAVVAAYRDALLRDARRDAARITF